QGLRLLIQVLAFFDYRKHKGKINKINMDGIKPPYLLLVNHNAFLDFKAVAMATKMNRTNSVVAIDGFLISEWLLRRVGCICTRKFTQDMTLVRHLKTVVNRGDIPIIYPEARYSLCGTNALLPESIGKLAKFLKVPVVTFINHGHHINSPFWNLKDRGTRVESTMTGIATAEELKKMSDDEVSAKIQQAFVYDDYAWQVQNKIAVTYPKRAEGLHKVLYQCPACKTEYRMTSKDNQLICTHCNKEWTMDEYSRLSADTGETEFSHIPDWYEWQRENVKQEVVSGTYRFESEVRVDSLPNAKRYIDLGKAKLRHDMNGFVLEGNYKGEDYRLEKSVVSMYSCHIEYNYLGKHGDCIDINTLTDTLYIYPEGENFSVTKIALATEELYKYETGGKGVIL
ncbi:MAG: 1-acyl-sn-glycerol-3-phosphate acyltransferase, partial [Eubacteriales bacterium]